MSLARLRERAARLKRDVLALWFALRHPRTPIAAKLVAAVVVGYALSPIDLIPDFIPVLGFLDDVILLPAGIALCLKLIPTDVLAECRQRAQASLERPTSTLAAVVIVALWIAALGLAGWWASRHFQSLRE
jgi:uncharacterized membrane protein YkvA (DUF1232 family)